MQVIFLIKVLLSQVIHSPQLCKLVNLYAIALFSGKVKLLSLQCRDLLISEITQLLSTLF